MAQAMSKKMTASLAPKLRVSISRAMSTAAVPQQQQQQQREVGRGRGRPGAVGVASVPPFGIFADLWDPLGSNNRSMRQMMDTMDRFMEPAAGGALRSSVRTPWDVVEKEDAFHLRVDMPGLDKSEVKINVEDEELVITGEHKVEDDVFGDGRKYNTRMILPKEVQKDKIKAELKNGVLVVSVPKLKPQDKKVQQIQVS